MPAPLAALPVRADLATAACVLADDSLADWLSADLGDADLLAQTLAWYQQHFAGQPEAAEMLHRRGLVADGLTETFDIGYAARQLPRQLPSATSAAGRHLRARWQALGLYRASGHAHFAGCVTFPLRDNTGVIQHVYGRKVGSRLTARSERHSYLLGRDLDTSAGLLNLPAFTVSDRLLLADSPLNALSLWCAGLRHVTCTFHGVAVSDALLAAMATHAVRHVTLVFRQTAAGQAAAAAAVARLQACDLAVDQVQLPDGLDANDVLRQQGADRLALRIEHAHAARPVRREPTERAAKQPPDPPVTVSTPTAITRTPPLGLLTEACSALDELHFTYDDRHYRVRGLAENLSPQRLKLNVQVRRDGLFHVHLFDLYSAHQRRQFIREASDELFVTPERIKHDLGQLLLALETQQSILIRQRLTAAVPPPMELSPAERDEALSLLRDPRLMERIAEDYVRGGLVGAPRGALLVYLAGVSRLLPAPLAILLQSSSAAGKTTLMDHTLRFFPPEAQVRYSALTGQSLYYLGPQQLAHKLLAIAEEEGVAQASYALKLLQSEGRLRIAAAGKDEHTGRVRTQEYTVEGPVMLLLTTTAEVPDPELANRCLVLRVDESPAQTAAIQAQQRHAWSAAAAAADQERTHVERRHQHAQRLLERQRVILPWAEQLTFRSDQTRMRRDHAKYLTLIAACTLLHQYQRPRHRTPDGEWQLVATRADVVWANRLWSEACGQRLVDLLPQTRAALEQIHARVAQCAQQSHQRPSEIRLTQRELREALGWSDFALRRQLTRLVQLEYLIPHRSGRGQQLVYELVYDGQGTAGEPFTLGLVDPETLYDCPD